jgi:hypothetical protein
MLIHFAHHHTTRFALFYFSQACLLLYRDETQTSFSYKKKISFKCKQFGKNFSKNIKRKSSWFSKYIFTLNWNERQRNWVSECVRGEFSSNDSRNKENKWGGGEGWAIGCGKTRKLYNIVGILMTLIFKLIHKNIFFPSFKIFFKKYF